MNLKVPGVRYRTVACLIMDQSHNLYLLLTLYLNIYLVDVLFKVTASTEHRLWIHACPENGRIYTAAAVGTSFIAPMLFLHLWDLKKARLDLGGLSQDYLQVNLFRRYLNYTETSRMKVPPAHM